MEADERSESIFNGFYGGFFVVNYCIFLKCMKILRKIFVPIKLLSSKTPFQNDQTSKKENP